jgi:hypothetical protein
MKKKKTHIEWKVTPLRERPLSAVVSLLLSLFCSVFAVFYIDNILISLPLVVVFSWSLLPLYLASSYEMSSKAISVTTLFRKRVRQWSEFKGVAAADRSVLLTRLHRQSFMDKWHGLVLFVRNKDEKLKVLEFAKECIKND